MELGSDLATRLQLEPVDMLECPLANAKDDNDMLKWVGGGLAVLGAVIGTVALHNAQPKEESSETSENVNTGVQLWNVALN
jgi:hypothetical protein